VIPWVLRDANTIASKPGRGRGIFKNAFAFGEQGAGALRPMRTPPKELKPPGGQPCRGARAEKASGQ